MLIQATCVRRLGCSITCRNSARGTRDITLIPRGSTCLRKWRNARLGETSHESTFRSDEERFAEKRSLVAARFPAPEIGRDHLDLLAMDREQRSISGAC